MTTRAEVKAAGAAAYKAERAYEDARFKYGQSFRKAEAEARERILAELKPDIDRVEELRLLKVAADEVADNMRVKAARESSEGLPLGAIVREYKRQRSFDGHVKRTCTGRQGRIDVWTRESVQPAGMRWGAPTVGDKYVRLLKRDGSDSARFEKLTGWGSEWLAVEAQR